MQRLIIFLLITSFTHVFAQTNVTFLSNLNQYPLQEYNDIWGYVDGKGIEYALLGCGHGTSIVRIDNPVIPQEVAFIPGPSSSWRDIKTHGMYAYIVTEGTGTGRGLQIVDLSQLPDTATLVNTLETWFTRAHNIYIDNGFAYVIGTNNGGGMHILDLSNPTNPTETAYYTASGYIHDVYVWNDTVVVCAGSSQIYQLIDVTNKSNPQLISSSISLPGIYAHSGWMTEDKRYFLACEEFNIRDITVWDLVDRTTWDLTVSSWSLPTGSSIIHNLFIKGDFAHISYYTSGYVVLDISDPTNPQLVAQYDTYPSTNGGTYNGAWGCYPYLPSGNTIISDIETGLYVLHFDGDVTRFSLSVSVADGWNMVSVPGVNPDGQKVENWWPGSDPGANVFSYDGGYSSITTTVPGEGYWMKNLGAQTYNTGDEWPSIGIETVSQDPIAGNAGWNLIGGYEDIVSTALLTTTPPGLIDGPIYEYSTGYQAASEIVPGYGYWVKLASAGNINFPSGSKLLKGETEKYFKDKWGRIKITDNSGKTYTLYCSDDKEDLDRFELPPIPPLKMFDIRFASNRSAENINGISQIIEMRGVEYPLTIKVEGIDINLSGESGIGLNINIKSGEEIKIYNSSVQRLRVSSETEALSFQLEQNYPNPFNPTTSISFTLPESQDVKLNIYNSLGEKIVELLNSRLDAGHHIYNWDAEDSASGVYFYEVQTQNYNSFKKMILLK